MTVTRDNFREFLQDKYKNNYREKTHSKENERQVEHLDYGSEDCRIQLNVNKKYGVTAKIYLSRRQWQTWS